MSLRHGRRLALLVALVALLVPGTASAASVSPTTTTGNPGCADINSNWSGIKVDNVPQEKTYSAGTRTVTVSNVGNQKTFDWTSNFPVTAVIVKASTDTYVYTYDPAVTGDTAMDSPGKYAISHVEWCYGSGDTPPPNPCGSADMDNDGVNDGCDNCPSVSNPDQMDSNDNGTGDACEPQPTCAEAHAGEADSDQDGVVDACDNCPTVMNPGQEDSDHNGTGDACEPTPPNNNDGDNGQQQVAGAQDSGTHRPPATRLPLRSPVLRQCSVSALQRPPRACRRRPAAWPVRSTPAFADRRSHVSCSVSTASGS